MAKHRVQVTIFQGFVFRASGFGASPIMENKIETIREMRWKWERSSQILENSARKIRTPKSHMLGMGSFFRWLGLRV